MNISVSPILRTDAYKQGHMEQYPEGTTRVVSNWTPRDNRHAPEGLDKMTWFGLQAYIKQTLERDWEDLFFSRDQDTVIAEYERIVGGMGLRTYPDQFRALHDLGYLPLEIWSLPEGSEVKMGIPTLVMWNTHPDFFWLTNFIETDMSANVWGPSTSASIAKLYRRILTAAADESGMSTDMLDFMGHDFSYRGMNGTPAALSSGGAHLTAFNGTDTVPALLWVEQNYGAVLGVDLIGGSVPATEHSVMCAGGADNEFKTYKRLLGQYPDGVISIVSDTWDYFKVLTEILPQLKDRIMAREGVVVIRPDSGNPVKIICGDPDEPVGSPEYKGSIELLAEVFGTTTNEKGFKVLDSHIGLIYGDSITPARAQMICDGLIAKGFCPSVVLGIGSYTYQYTTRDTFGQAIKATSVTIDGNVNPIFKDPVTARGGLTKKSAVGIPVVYSNEDGFVLVDGSTIDEVRNCAFVRTFIDGGLDNPQAWADITARVRA